MAEIDEELLALAGDASSDEEDAPMNISGASSLSPEGRNRDGSARPGRKSGGRRGGGGDQNDSEEEGEASSGPGSPDSLQSAPMEESDSDSDTSPATLYEVDNEINYPLEGKFKDETDRAEIMAMPEIKREEILADRAQKIAQDRQNRALRKLIKQRDQRDVHGKTQEKKRKASSAGLEESQRKTSRQRTKLGGGRVGEASSGIDNLKRARAEKDDRQRRRREDNERMKERRSLGLEEYSDHDAGAESDLEWDENKKKDKNGRSPSADFQDAQPATFSDVQHVRIGRGLFAKICFYPGFEEVITGCYVRISIGVDRESGQNIYRMALIKGFVEGKPYAMDTANGKRIVINQYLRGAHGKTERSMPFIQCSESPFTEHEWSRYQRVCQAEGVPIPTRPKLRNKVEDVSNLINRSWTEAELTEKLRRSGALTNKDTSLRRSRISIEIKQAEAAGDDEKVEELRAELEKLEGPKLAFNTSLSNAPKKGTSTMNHKAQQERIAILNLENRRKNMEDVRQAQLAERRAAKRTEAAIARGEVVAEDSSKRLRTRAKFSHNVSETPLKKKESEDNGASNSAKNTAKSTITVPKMNRSDSKGLPGLRRPLQDDDIIGSIDLGIDLEL